MLVWTKLVINIVMIILSTALYSELTVKCHSIYKQLGPKLLMQKINAVASHKWLRSAGRVLNHRQRLSLYCVSL